MFVIRKAMPGDCRGLAEVRVDSYRTAYAGLLPQPFLDQFTYDEQEQDWVNLIQSASNEFVTVAVTADGRVVGYVLAKAEPDIFPGYDSEVVALHVRLSARSNGIGKALLRAALRGLAERHCASVMLWTLQGNPVRRWYERLQGAPLGEKRYRIDESEVVEIAFGWKSLSALDRTLEAHGAG